jgi:hypothetical protein
MSYKFSILIKSEIIVIFYLICDKIQPPNNPITRLFDFPYYQQDKYSNSRCFKYKQNGVWVKTSTQEYIAQANAVSESIIANGN